MSKDTVEPKAQDLVAFQLMSSRVSHFEQLILGMATVGLTGWGFILSRQVDPKETDIGWLLFTFLFSGVVASAFNGLYMARCEFNRVVFKIEQHLHLAQAAHLGYFHIAGRNGMRSFYFTALFVPVISVIVLLYGAYLSLLAIDAQPGLELIGIPSTILFVTWFASLLVTIVSTLQSTARIRDVFKAFCECSKRTEGPQSPG